MFIEHLLCSRQYEALFTLTWKLREGKGKREMGMNNIQILGLGAGMMQHHSPKYKDSEKGQGVQQLSVSEPPQ